MAVVLEQWQFSNSSTGLTITSTPVSGNVLVSNVYARRDVSATNAAPLFTSTSSPAWTEVDQSEPMDEHTAAIFWRTADGTESVVSYSASQTISARGNVFMEFSGISSPVLDEFRQYGSGGTEVTSAPLGATGTLDSATGVAVVVGVNRRGLNLNDLAITPGTWVELHKTGIAGNRNFNVNNWYQVVPSTAAYNVTVTETVASRMGAVIGVFTGGGGGGNNLTETVTESIGLTDVDDVVEGAGSRVPQNLTATTFDDDRIDLAWDAVAAATGYDIERDGAVIVTDHPTNSYSDTGLDPSTAYDYRVRSVL